MKLNSSLQEKFRKDSKSVVEAKRLAFEIAFGPVVFQISRLMKKFGIFEILNNSKNGLTIDEISEKTKISKYACKCLLESSLTMGTVLCNDGKFSCSKAGWFLNTDEIIDVFMDFNHNVNYLGLYNLEESLLNSKPQGLINNFGNWSNIFEAFEQLPENVRDSWTKFNNFYSTNTFEQALQFVFSQKPESLLDIGGNIGKWALYCVEYDPDVKVTVLDLPHQIELMKQHISGKNGSNRIFGHCCNLLDAIEEIPTGFDAIWISQLIVNFSEQESIDILTRIAKSMNSDSNLYIMETFWDRHHNETAAFIVAQFSLYFNALSTGKGKCYTFEELSRFLEAANLKIIEIKDDIGKGHSIIKCKKIL